MHVYGSDFEYRITRTLHNSLINEVCESHDMRGFKYEANVCVSFFS